MLKVSRTLEGISVGMCDAVREGEAAEDVAAVVVVLQSGSYLLASRLMSPSSSSPWRQKPQSGNPGCSPPSAAPGGILPLVTPFFIGFLFCHLFFSKTYNVNPY
jgi:hypothetical protein